MTTPTFSPVTGSRWDQLVPDPGSTWTPTRAVTACIPARNPGRALDHTLRALGRQTYPRHLLDVVVADDRSSTPLVAGTAAEQVEVVRLDEGDGFGGGTARNRAAAVAQGEILVFLDADVIPDARFVEACARWFDRSPDVVVLGNVQFVDVDGMSAHEIDAEVAAWPQRRPFSGRLLAGADWRGDYLRRTRCLTVDEADVFRIVTGAALAVLHERFDDVGGFSEVPVRGVDDIELGYRLHVNGGIFVPDRAALAWHQGVATSRGARASQIESARRAHLAQLIPVGGMRPSRRRHVPRDVVPVMTVHLPDEAPAVAEALVLTHGGSDVVVTRDPSPPVNAFDAAWAHVWLRHDVAWGPTTRQQLVRMLSRPGVDVVRTPPDPTVGPALAAYTTRSIRRTGYAGCDDVLSSATSLFGTCWVDEPSLGLDQIKPDSANVEPPPGLLDRYRSRAAQTLAELERLRRTRVQRLRRSNR